jgi:hypothetical protein
MARENDERRRRLRNYRLRRCRQALRNKELATLELGETAPDAERLADVEGVVRARRADRTNLADRLGSLFTALSLVLALKGGWRKEEVGVIAPTQGPQLPVIR